MWDHHQKASGNTQVYAVLSYASFTRKEKQLNSAESYANGFVFSIAPVRTLITPSAALMSARLRKLFS
jgi:hypothetical protein